MYLLDEQMGLPMIKTLQEFGEPFSLIHSVYDVFGASLKDPPLIPQIAAKDLILVTRDRKMKK